MILNNRFDTSKPILESLIDEVSTNGELSDYAFSQACSEYNVEEDDVMELMLSSEKYEFSRTQRGWDVTKK